MSINQTFIAEMKHEAASSRKMLERIPTDKLTWQPHDKSMQMGRLASHVAELPSWVTMMMATDELDLAARTGGPAHAVTSEELLAAFDKNMDTAVEALEKASDADLAKIWTLRKGEHVIAAMPKTAFMRSLVYNHLYHHRGQLSVYLRLQGIPVPGMYGPSADDMN